MTMPAPSFYFPAPRTQKFCSQCGSSLTQRIPADDSRIRDVCDNCGAIHYQNPRNVVGVLPVLGDKVLLCRRAIHPRYDKWTLPAGFMELGETTAQGAERETQEEAGAQIELGPLYTVIDVPYANQVHFFFLAKVLSTELNPGPESLEAGFFSKSEIPWDDLAFRTVSTTLEHYFNDQPSGRFPMRHYDIPWPVAH
ncbi:MAG TPA: NUDIX hydrolase [Eoetvoesiella sp.]|jgi:ADP-ribose pyrophosphatase YjhB (NUDIX family)|uniref:NUDIX hydrolase n=1 Tax=Eoetvoesiella sp. TaxID=1966355 RepID=UPI002CD6CA56|nr:NUDIX hydrolase [Eoetvoesiella sp.]HWK60530.1 NUDIX hydrolase [Eoetvoesiella sp.]